MRYIFSYVPFGEMYT